jgi:uncharacterized membrane protein HdeD (DUF308 family)
MNDNSFHISNLVRGISRAAILSGLLAVVLGVVMLAWPQPSIVAAAVLLGVYLVVSGVALVFLAFSLPASAGSRFLTFISGVASVALGILAFRHFGEGYAILLLAIWVATGFIIRGVFVTASAISVPGFPGRGWAIVFGFISIIAGFVMLAYPFDSIETLALVVGACLIILGEVEVGTGVGMRRDVKKAENSVMSADWPVRAAPTITDKSIALQ